MLTTSFARESERGLKPQRMHIEPVLGISFARESERGLKPATAAGGGVRLIRSLARANGVHVSFCRGPETGRDCNRRIPISYGSLGGIGA